MYSLYINIHNQRSLETTPWELRESFISYEKQVSDWVLGKGKECGGGAGKVWVRNPLGPITLPDVTSSVAGPAWAPLPSRVPMASLLLAHPLGPA